jgi:hypothetical protein
MGTSSPPPHAPEVLSHAHNQFYSNVIEKQLQGVSVPLLCASVSDVKYLTELSQLQSRILQQQCVTAAALHATASSLLL